MYAVMHSMIPRIHGSLCVTLCVSHCQAAAAACTLRASYAYCIIMLQESRAAAAAAEQKQQQQLLMAPTKLRDFIR